MGARRNLRLEKKETELRGEEESGKTREFIGKEGSW